MSIENVIASASQTNEPPSVVLPNTICYQTKCTLTFSSAQSLVDSIGTLIALQVCNNTRNAFPIFFRFLEDPEKKIQTMTLLFVLSHHTVTLSPGNTWCVLKPKPTSSEESVHAEALAVAKLNTVMYNKMEDFTKSLFPDMNVTTPKETKIFFPYRFEPSRLAQYQDQVGNFVLRIGNGWISPDKETPQSKGCTGYYLNFGAYKFTKKFPIKYSSTSYTGSALQKRRREEEEKDVSIPAPPATCPKLTEEIPPIPPIDYPYPPKILTQEY